MQSIGSSAEVIIPNVNVSDSGIYVCSASNAYSNASQSIVINVVNGTYSKIFARISLLTSTNMLHVSFTVNISTHEIALMFSA